MAMSPTLLRPRRRAAVLPTPVEGSAPNAPTGISLTTSPLVPTALTLTTAPSPPLTPSLATTPDSPTGVTVETGLVAPTNVGLLAAPKNLTATEVFAPDSPTGLDLTAAPASPTGVQLSAVPSEPTSVTVASVPSSPTGVGLLGAPTNVVATESAATDPYFSDVVLLLQDSLTDESPQGQTLVSTGAQVTASVVKYGSGSLEFTGGYLTNSGTSLAFGGGDFTLEFWLYMNPSAASQRFIWDARGGPHAGDRPVIWVQNNSHMSLYASGYRLDSNSVLSLATWHHVALVRSGGISKWYIDGQDETGTLIGTEQSWTVNSQTVIGASTETSSPLSGYIDDLRLTNGIARYTSNFTPPTSAFPN